MISKKWLRLTGVAGVLALSLAACGNDNGNGDGNGNGNGNGSDEQLSGSVLLDGSSTVEPISSVAAELFMRENNGVQVSVATSGTGGGFEKFCAGETDISNASREIRDDEQALCEQNGIAWEQITVANDALSVLVNPENPVDCLTVEQLRAIWEPGSTLSNWNEIPGLDVDFDQRLDLFGPGTDSGTFGYFTEAINDGEGAQRTDYENIGEDDNLGIAGIEGSTGGMFYVGYTYYAENQDRVKALQIDSGDGCVEPSEATVQDGSYTPLGRGLYIYPSDTALEKPAVQAFIEFYIDRNDEIAGTVGAIPMTSDQRDGARDQVASLIGS